MALNDYSQLAATMDGNPLTQVTSISMTTNSGDQRVDLLNEGLGGFTPGSGDVTIEIGYVIPIAGTEDEFQQKCARRDFVTMQVWRAGKSYMGHGKILTDQFSQSVNGSVEGSFTWTGEVAEVQ